MTVSPKREICEGCSKPIYLQHKVIICQSCDVISHHKCCKDSYTYNNISDCWYCSSCSNNTKNKYAPFESICFNKYLDNDPEAFEEINKIKALLNNCKVISNNELNKKFFGYQDAPFSIFSNNIDGLAANFDMLNAQLSTLKNNFDIIALVETNIYEEHKNLYNISGYKSVFNSKISDKHKGSGLGVYAKENLVVNKLVDICICTEDIEVLFVEISDSMSSISIGVVYRPPNGSITNFYSIFESLLVKLPNNCIISGDFNIDLFKNSEAKNKFENLFFGNGFIPSICHETHIKPDCDPSCIDNIFVSNPEHVLGSGILYELKVTHHLPTVCFYNINFSTDIDANVKCLPCYDYCESNIVKFNDMLSTKFLNNNFPVNENGFNEFNKVIHESIEECFKIDPKNVKSKRNRLLNPWITSGLINSINYKNHLYNKWKKSKRKNNKCGDQNLYLKYAEYRTKLTDLIRVAKAKFYSKQFDQCNGNSKKTWTLINELRGKKVNKLNSSFLIDGKVIKERRIIADEFNKYFTSIAVNLNEEANKELCIGIPIISVPNFTTYIEKHVSDSMYFAPCSVDEIQSVIGDLDNSKASDISIRILKICAPIISPYLNIFFNKFIDIGIFPDILKIGEITPIFKKGNSELMKNYRPVSTLPCFGKIFEKIIYSRLYNFFTSKGIIYENQYGFRRHHSTSHAVNYSVNKIISNIEKKSHVLGIFIDLSKAFDTICHVKLQYKLENYGIRGTPLKLLKSYITNRKQLTKFNGTKSDTKSVLFGVPQGSVLGPLLFIIYINDIVKSSTLGHFVMFADDTNIFVVGKTANEAYQKANKLLNDLHLYMLSNQLHINFEKCVYMHFRPRLNNSERKSCARNRIVGSDPQLFINGLKIKKTDKARYLGIIIDENLNWNMHIEYLQQKLNSCIITIKRIKKFIPKEHYLKLYFTLFVSHLTYGITAWGSSSCSKLTSIFSIQKRCIRLLFGKELNFDHAEYYKTCARTRPHGKQFLNKNYELEHTKPLFANHKLLTVHNLYIFFVFNEIFKIQKYHCPIPLSDLLFKNCDDTRQNRNNFLAIPKYIKKSSQVQFLFNGIKVWNKYNQKVLCTSLLNEGMQIVIPGSNTFSDLSTPVSHIKNKFKNILLSIQNKGDTISWEHKNFVL